MEKGVLGRLSTVTLSPLAELGGVPLAVGLGAGGQWLALQAEALDLDGDGVTYGTVTRQDGHTIRVVLPEIEPDLIQPTPDGGVMIMAARQQDPRAANAWRHDPDGSLLAAISLGPQLRDAQVAHDGTVWCAHGGGAALVRGVDLEGWPRFEHALRHGDDDQVADVDALNLTHDQVWVCTYPGGTLFQAGRAAVTAHGVLPEGTRALAVSGGRVAAWGAHHQRSRVELLALNAHHGVEQVGTVELRDRHGQPLEPVHGVGRGDDLLLRRGTELYRVTLRMLWRSDGARLS